MANSAIVNLPAKAVPAAADLAIVSDSAAANVSKKTTWSQIFDTFGAKSFRDQTGGTGDTYGALAGLVNGVNKVFTVSQSIYDTGSLEVELNGQAQIQGTSEDWVETNPATGTFTFATAPETGDRIKVRYGDAGATIPVIPLSTFQINQESDLPTAVAGVITIVTSGLYVINFNYTSVNKIVIADGVFATFDGLGTGISSIVSTAGSGAHFSGDDIGEFYLRTGLTVSGPGMDMLDFTPVASSTGSIFVEAGVVTDYASLGAVTNLTTVSWVNDGVSEVSDGITVTDVALFNFHASQWVGKAAGTGTYITVAGTAATSVGVNGASFSMTALETIFDITNTNATGSISNNQKSADGIAFASGSEDSTSVNWNSNGNVRIKNSSAFVEISITTAAATALGALDTAVPVNGTWADAAERFTTDAAGIMTYTGLEDVSLLFGGTVSMTGGANNQDVNFFFAKGNAAENAITAFADAGGGQVTVTNTAHGLANGDRVYIKGTTSYNGDFIIANVTANTFEITDTFVANDATGEWQVLLPKSEAQNTLTSTTRASNTGIQAREDMSTGDTMQLFVESPSDATSPTAQTANISTAK